MSASRALARLPLAWKETEKTATQANTPYPPFLFLLSPHAFARLALGSRFLPLREKGKDCYTG